jgi:hypothetical protein
VPLSLIDRLRAWNFIDRKILYFVLRVVVVNTLYHILLMFIVKVRQFWSCFLEPFGLELAILFLNIIKLLATINIINYNLLLFNYSFLRNSQSHKQILSLLVTNECYWALFYMSLYQVLHTLLNKLAESANKMRLQKKSNFLFYFTFLSGIN